MGTFTANILCCSCKLYKIGLLIAFVYLIPNLLVLSCVFLNGYYDNTLPLLGAVIVLSSIILLRDLMEERHELLFFWQVTMAVLIVFNLILLTLQFDAADNVKVKENFYLEFLVLISLEIQVFFWCLIYCLFKYGHDKSASITTISKDLEMASKDLENVQLPVDKQATEV